MSQALRAATLLLVLTGAGTAAASNINSINSGMPNRISMNVTTPKQTQGATFGEKVNAGLQSAGSAVTQGVSIVIECGTSACVVALPDGSGYRAELDAMTISPLEASQGESVRKAPAGAALLGGALPGGSILSAAVSSVTTMAGSGAGSGAAAASYAATGRSVPAPTPLPSRAGADGNIDITQPLADGDYAMTVVVEKATSGLKDTLKTQVRTAPRRIRMDFYFSATGGVLRARHDIAMNSIGNMR